ncbi:sedoheptulokinase [Rubinisphaera margarita]|uniref:sedoheptulokinase n=1 Tax=Rubinisphaera margarita TaxID=2909586 RepID=UPI001EE9768E|nr:FGGY family carbohydrate kinase [Rubinisphaera margarita]MCG6154449.1 hypothetical protein [Rubinisphaera margarita]
MNCLLGLDFGTTSVSAVSISPDGELLGVHSRKHDAFLPHEDPLARIQSLDRLAAVAKECLKSVLAEANAEPLALGLTGQMHGFICLDAAGQAVSDLITWLDFRSLSLKSAGNEAWSAELKRKLTEEVRERLGCDLHPGYALLNVYALHKSGLLPGETAAIIDITGYFRSVLSSEPTVIDPTFAASWGIYNVRDGRVDEEVIAISGLDPTLFPACSDDRSVAQHVTAEAAKTWSLPEGLPVYLGIGDNQAAAHAAIENPETDLLINIGTGGQICWPTREFLPSKSIEVRPFLDGYLLNVGAGVSGGRDWQTYVRSVHGWLRDLGFEMEEHELLERLKDAATECAKPGRRDGFPIFEPVFSGTRSDRQRRGHLSNLTDLNFNLREMSYAAVVGVLNCVCEPFDEVPHSRGNRKRIVLTGNFFEHFPWLSSRVAHRYRCTVVMPVHPEQAAVGAAMLAGSGLNRQSSIPRRYKTLSDRIWDTP